MISYQHMAGSSSSSRGKQVDAVDNDGGVKSAGVSMCESVSGEALKNNGVETTSLERKSLLDPHLSVLELLERTGEKSSMDEKRLGPNLVESVNNIGASNNSISESWQAIHRNEAFISVIPERCSSQANAVGILSSSDTSEEEPDPTSSPNIAHHPPLHQQQPQQPMCSLKDFRSMRLDLPLVLPEVDQEGRGGDGDDETITKSLSSSSNSFVMPKLSLSQKSHKLRILILGRPGLKFYQSIPKRYQHFFEFARFQDPSEFRKFTGILLVFQELKEMVSLLNRVCQCAPTRPIIPVCQTGQHQQVRNVLDSLLKSKLISLLYPPVVISNHSDLNNMFRFLQDLSKTISDNSDDEAEESDVADNRLKKSYLRKKKRAGNYNRNKPRRRRTKNEKFNKWILWGISLTVGVGVGYCMSYFASSALISMNAKNIASIDGCPSSGLVVFDDPSLTMGDYENDIENPFAHALYLFKQTIRQWNWAVKQFLSKHLRLVEHLISQDWASDENSNRALALGYILL